MSESSRKSIEALALEEAVARCDDSQSELARRIDKSQGHISTWLRRGRCPADVVLAIETATGVSRHRLRPDVFGVVPMATPGDGGAPAATAEAAE